MRRGLRRGMGYTGPYGGFTAYYQQLAARSGAVAWRCGYPEIPECFSAPNNSTNSGTFDTSDIETQARAVLDDGMDFVFVFLGVPRQAQPNAGSSDHANYSGGEWHHYPTSAPGRTLMAFTAAVVANLLADLEDEYTGRKVYMQVANEVNIPAFNHDPAGNTNTTGYTPAVVAEYLKEITLAVKTAQPAWAEDRLLGPSLASRGDIHYGPDAGKTAPDWAAALVAAEPSLATPTGGDDARFAAWVSHPYTGSVQPLHVGWALTGPTGSKTAVATTGSGWGGLPQMVAMREELVDAGATCADGTFVKVAVGEYGTRSYGSEGSINFTPALQNTYVTQYLQAFDELSNASIMDEPWLFPLELYYEELGDEKTLYEGDSPDFTRLPAGGLWDFASLYVPSVEPPDPPEDPGPSAPVEPLTVLIEIGVPTSTFSDTTSFTVDDDPLGEVGPTGGPIPPNFTWIEISDDAVAYQTRRGRSREYDRIEAGTASVVVHNDNTESGTAGDHDALNWNSPFFPYLGPDCRLRISVDGQAIFTGDLIDVPIVDEKGGIVTTTYEAVDILAALAKEAPFKPEAVHTAGQRIKRLLDRAGAFARGDSSFLFSGVNTYQRGTRQTGTTLDQIQDVATSEGGMFYASAGSSPGVGTCSYNFIDRAHMHDADAAFLATDDEHATDAILYSDVGTNSGRDTLFNIATIKPLGRGKPYTAVDDVSVNARGKLPMPEQTLPIATLFGRAFRAIELVNECKDPVPRFTFVEFDTSTLPLLTRRSSIIGQEIGHVIDVERTRPGDILPPTPTQRCVIQSVSHSGERGGQMTTRFDLSPQFET